jgi:hypothetical protein
MRKDAVVSSARAARLPKSSRLRQRVWRAEGEPLVPGLWIGALMVGLYVALLYKIPALGVVMLLALVCCLPLMRYASWRLDPLMAGLALGYAALATLTAFMVSFSSGVFRSFEFAILAGAALTITIYFKNVSEPRRTRLVAIFAALNLIVLLHVVYFHVAMDVFGAWKYLADTKFVFTAITLVLFYYEDDLRRVSWLVWIGALVAVLTVILFSGERKALLFVAIAFLLSRERTWLKAALLALAGGLLLVSTFAPAEVPSVLHKISSFGNAGSKPSNRYFLSRNIIDHSDETRFFVNRNAERLFEENPVFGIGATGYATWAYRRYGSVSESGGLSMNVHGERYRVPVENGWVGILWVFAYLGFCAACVGRAIAAKGGLQAGSKDRAPAYALVMLVTYGYSEALDSTMLLLILIVGFWAATVGTRSPLPYGRGRTPARLRASRQSPLVT